MQRFHGTKQNIVCSRACGLGVASHLPNQSEFHHKQRCDENVILAVDLDLKLQRRLRGGRSIN